MAIKRAIASVALLLMLLIWVQVAITQAAGPETFAAPQIVAQGVATPTPFRFLTPTPFTSQPSTTTSPTSTTAPRAGGFPLELVAPLLAGGLGAIGGGSLLLRRRRS